MLMSGCENWLMHCKNCQKHFRKSRVEKPFVSKLLLLITEICLFQKIKKCFSELRVAQKKLYFLDPSCLIKKHFFFYSIMTQNISLWFWYVFCIFNLHIYFRYNIDIAGGLGSTSGKVWRIGLMGYNCNAKNISETVDALLDCIHSVSFKSNL